MPFNTLKLAPALNTKSDTWVYQKPAYLCEPAEEIFPDVVPDPIEYGRIAKEQIQLQLESQGFVIRLAEDADILRLEQFILKRYDPLIASEVSPFDMYRFLRYGHGVVVHRPESDEVLGCIFAVNYDAEPKESYTIRLGVDESLKGLNLGVSIMRYSCFHAMSKGARIKTGIIDFDNYTSLYINLNKVGWICPRFDAYIECLGSCFDILLPLDVTGLTTNVISDPKMYDFIRTAREGSDYRLINWKNLEEMHRMYRDTDFVVTAFARDLEHQKDHQFLALPATELNLKRG